MSRQLTALSAIISFYYDHFVNIDAAVWDFQWYVFSVIVIPAAGKQTNEDAPPDIKAITESFVDLVLFLNFKICFAAKRFFVGNGWELSKTLIFSGAINRR